MARLNFNSPSRTNSTSAPPTSRNRTVLATTSTSASATTSRSYRLQDSDNPFQESLPSSSPTAKSAAAAPIPSDTIASSTSRTAQQSTTVSSSRATTAQMPSAKATSNANTTAATATTYRTIASGKSGRQEPRDDHDEYDNDIPEDEHGNGDDMDEDNHRDDEMEKQPENPLIHLTQNQREAAVENLEIESTAFPSSQSYNWINRHHTSSYRQTQLTPNPYS